jgi:hypothetical protein
MGVSVRLHYAGHRAVQLQTSGHTNGRVIAACLPNRMATRRNRHRYGQVLGGHASVERLWTLVRDTVELRLYARCHMIPTPEQAVPERTRVLAGERRSRTVPSD